MTSGKAYVVPVAGKITSWSTYANSGAGQKLTLKVFRKIADPSTYRVVGHNGPRPLAASVLNTLYGFTIPVRPGDVIGLGTPADSGGPACLFGAPGDENFYSDGNLADGASDIFTAGNADTRLNVAATIVPSNRFALGGTTRNRKRGTATLTVNVPNPGGLAVWGNGVKAINKQVTAAGKAKISIRAKGKQQRSLNENRKVTLKIKIKYTPTGGKPSTESTMVKLRKR